MSTITATPAYILARAAWVPPLVLRHADGRYTRAVCGLYGDAGGELAPTTFVHATFVQLTAPVPTASIQLRGDSTFPRVLSGRRRGPRLHQGLRVAPPTNPPRAG